MKSSAINSTIGSERIVELTNRIFHFPVSCERFVCSECSPGAAISKASYPASTIAFLSASGFVLFGLYLIRAFSEAKFTFASVTHGTCLRDFSMSPEQLEQCMPPISKVAMEGVLDAPLTRGVGGLLWSSVSSTPSVPLIRGILSSSSRMSGSNQISSSLSNFASYPVSCVIASTMD